MAYIPNLQTDGMRHTTYRDCYVCREQGGTCDKATSADYIARRKASKAERRTTELGVFSRILAERRKR